MAFKNVGTMDLGLIPRRERVPQQEVMLEDSPWMRQALLLVRLS